MVVNKGCHVVSKYLGFLRFRKKKHHVSIIFVLETLCDRTS